MVAAPISRVVFASPSLCPSSEGDNRVVDAPLDKGGAASGPDWGAGLLKDRNRIAMTTAIAMKSEA